MTECVNCAEPIRRTETADRVDGYAWVHYGGNPVCGLTMVASPGGDGYGPAPADPAAQVEAVLDVLAPEPDIPADARKSLGISDGLRVPIILVEHHGNAVYPTDEQLRALAEQIVTAIRTASGRAGHG